MLEIKMLRKRVLLIEIILLISCKFLYAQYYDTGQDPASLKWNQIDTKNFKIIFPDNIDSIGRQMANTMEYIAEFGGKTLEHQPKKIPVILRNQTSISNGMVVWAPRRSEFYITPSQSDEPGDWLSRVALHEYRHVVQIDKLNQGITRKLSWLIGEQATALVLGLHVPRWFLEGDAVVTETALTNSGRGRIPDFEMKLRAQVLEKGIYNFDKAVFGSYKDYIPDPYQLGYQIVAYNRIKYGTQLWPEVINTIGNDPFHFTPFSRSLRIKSDLNKEGLYKQTLNELRNKWEEQSDKTRISEKEEFVSINNNYYTNYNYPFYLSDTELFVERSGIDDVHRFIILNKNGSEETILIPGSRYHNSISINNDMLVWDELEFDPRWANRTYSVIYTYNINAKAKKKLTARTKYFSPAINKNNDKIVAVKVNTNNIFAMDIIDAQNGEVLKTIPNPGNHHLITPVWSPDGNEIAVIYNSHKGKALALINMDNGVVQILIPFSNIEIAQAVFYKNYILYIASYSGISNVYAVERDSKNIFQLTSVIYGVKDHQLSPDGKKLVFANYTIDGYRIFESIIKEDDWIPINEVQDNSIKLYKLIAEQEDRIFEFDEIPNLKYDIKPYKKALNLFNVHSWGPFALSLTNFGNVNPGISVLSQNLLSTSFTSAGYEILLNELTGRFFVDYLYKGFYPELGLRVESGKRSISIGGERYIWNQNSIVSTISLPLSFNHGNSFRGFNAKLQGKQNYNSEFDDLPHPISNKNTSLGVSLSAYHYLKYSVMDLYPRIYQNITINYSNYFTDKYIGDIYAVQGYLTFPGLMNHDGILLYAAFQNKSNAGFNNFIQFPVGYNGINGDKIQSYFANWSFPIMYPDLRLKMLMYCKRIKSSVFYNYTISRSNDVTNYYTSFGIDVTGDFNFFRLIVPFEVGYRIAYLPELNSFYQKILFSIEINSLY